MTMTLTPFVRPGAPPVGFQIVLRRTGSPVLCQDAAARRAFSGALLRVGKDRGLLAFGAADTHGHILMVGDRTMAGELAHAAETALAYALPSPVGFGAAEITVVRDQAHLVSTFRYVQRNAAHHGVTEPGATEASSLHDLLGLRIVAPWLGFRVRRLLPRTTRDELLELMNLPTLGVSGEPSPSTLAPAAAAAIGRADLRGDEPMVVAVRTAAVALVRDAWRPAEIGRALGLTERSVRRHSTREARADVLEGLRRQLAWRAAVAMAPDALSQIVPCARGVGRRG